MLLFFNTCIYLHIKIICLQMTWREIISFNTSGPTLIFLKKYIFFEKYCPNTCAHYKSHETAVGTTDLLHKQYFKTNPQHYNTVIISLVWKPNIPLAMFFCYSTGCWISKCQKSVCNVIVLDAQRLSTGHSMLSYLKYSYKEECVQELLKCC